uniref:Uncharacterized protein n=1 Tax=Chinchilla lanigera TaxID=34839 RepID=A0A8C2VRK2_CHILA
MDITSLSHGSLLSGDPVCSHEEEIETERTVADSLRNYQDVAVDGTQLEDSLMNPT